MDTKEVINFASKTLTGDVRDFLVNRLRNLPKVWEQMSEAEQEEQIEAATEAADNLVRCAVKIIASGGRQTVDARLEKITISKSCELKITTNICNIESLTPCLNDAILLVTSGVDEFSGERAPCKATPDEPELFLEEKSSEEEPDEKDFLGIDGDDDEAA